MTNTEALQFAEEWVANFNRRNLQALLGHFSEKVRFTSPRAVALTGRATLESRNDLAAYWMAALQSIRSLHFTLESLVNDAAARRLAILYLAEIDGERKRAIEIYDFDSAGRIITGEAMYGAAEASDVTASL